MAFRGFDHVLTRLTGRLPPAGTARLSLVPLYARHASTPGVNGMSQVAERKRPDPYADENTIVRRKRGVTIGAYQGLTIAVLACLVGALFFLGVNTAGQKAVSVVALVVAAAFLYTMARRKSRTVESDRTQMIVAVWLVGTALCWIAMAV